MNRTVNLISLLEAKKSLSAKAFDAFRAYHEIGIKPVEILDLEAFCIALQVAGLSIIQFENFHVGYKIPQIGKEFDLLRLDEKTIVNIEIKQKSPADKILAQLKRNKYYLAFTNRKIHQFAFLSETSQIFTLDSDENLSPATINDVASAIQEVNTHHFENISAVFNPSDYLVSPFNSTEKFLAGTYFLTGHQEEIVKSIMSKVKKGHSFSSISGGPGTGKSLLAYSLAKTAMSTGHKVLIIHCGNLNEGQDDLKSAGYSIVSVKDTLKQKDEHYDLLIIDEAQRIRAEQFNIIIAKAKADGVACVFSHDERQTLAQFESKTGVSQKIKSAAIVEKYELSEKIRTNAEISDFIKVFINRNRTIRSNYGPNITFSFFEDKAHAQDYWKSLPPQLWKRLRLTPSQHDVEHHEKFYQGEGETSHNVIGQEFDGVAIMIDDMFAYNQNGELIYKAKSYYDPVKMIFQNITRTRKRLNIIVVNNEEIADHLMQVLAG